MMRQLGLVDGLVAEGREVFTFDDAREMLGVSASATANALRRLRANGLVDRVSRGQYAVRPLGSLGTSVVAEDPSVAVGAAFAGREHRIGYLSAAGELGLLAHPVRTVHVACDRQVRIGSLSGRKLKAVIERPATIRLGAEQDKGSRRSGLERTLLDCALRVDLVGSSERLAEVVANGGADADPVQVGDIAAAFGSRGLAAIRRLASLARVLDVPLRLAPDVNTRQPVIRLNPGDDHVEWTDPVFRVAWDVSTDELRAVTDQ